jgi:hypothetical protein
MKRLEVEGEPYWFKVTIRGFEIRVDQCIMFRMITGTIILIMTAIVFLIAFGVIGNSK